MSASVPSAAALARAGIPEAARVAEAVASHAAWLQGAGAARVTDGLVRAGDPVQAAWGLAELLALAAPDPATIDVEALLITLGGSVALRTALVGAGPGWPALARDMITVTERTAPEHGERLRQALAGAAPDREATARTLRRYVHREEVRIGGRDLDGSATVDETVREISALADAVVAAAVEATRARLEAEWPRSAELPFVVLGMGKLGGRELNYSSDIDLVYVYDADGPLPDGRTRREYFVRVGEELTRLLAEVTDDGFCYRVDLRLRPGGNDGPIASALPALLSYYESWGQTWERAVWLKARPVAGDAALGARVLAGMEPFVFRRYLDFGTLEALKSMKVRVDASLRDRSRRRRDVKLGWGGIREVEFVVQAQQLVHGGKDARLRTRGTLATLERLAAAGYVPEEVRARLAAGYRFLRDVEHKLQIVHRRQTQTIPTADDEVRALARRLGYRGSDPTEPFWRDHAEHTGHVRLAFEELFRTDENVRDARAELPPALVALFDPLASSEQAVETLAELDFADPAQASRDLARLLGEPSHSPASERRRVAMERLGPVLLAEIVASADRDRALAQMATFFENVGARTSYLHLLDEHEGVRRLLVRLFASSEFLSRFFVKNPELLEALVRVDLVRVAPTIEEQRAELADRLAAAPDLEAELDVLRRFRHEEFLRIGIHDLEGDLTSPEAEEQLTRVATVCLAAAIDLARRDVCRRSGVAVTAATDGLAAIGMGKLGGRELAYGSDLDLVFVWAIRDGTDWPGPVAPLDFYTRVVQRTISALQTQTNEGYAYKIDTRLRPSGNQGTLVTSVDGFEEYHRTSAAVWERQALVKARVVHGPAFVTERVEAAIDAFVYGRSLSDEECAEIRRVRARMERERGEESIKTGLGGVVDVEFAVQVLQLRHGHADPALRTPSTRRALAALADAAYVEPAHVRALSDGYDFLRRLESRLRIERDQPGDAIPANQAARLRLARRLGYDGPPPAPTEALVADLARHREAIRTAYFAIVGDDSGPA